MTIMLNQEETKRLENYWLKGAEEDLKTAKALFESKRYHHCLFFCHLFLEKMLKALVIKTTRRHCLPIHNLLKLAHDAKISLSQDIKQDLATINEFNIRARYNDYKFKFYKRATYEYTIEWFNKCKTIYLWLRRQLKKK